jgi:hypothetical protein
MAWSASSGESCVVYYNALILSEALAELELRGDLDSAEVLNRVSPVAWQHINFYGRYQFDEEVRPGQPGTAPPAVLVGGGFKGLRHRRSLVHIVPLGTIHSVPLPRSSNAAGSIHGACTDAPSRGDTFGGLGQKPRVGGCLSRAVSRTSRRLDG